MLGYVFYLQNVQDLKQGGLLIGNSVALRLAA
jgi:hypothetical protein